MGHLMLGWLRPVTLVAACSALGFTGTTATAQIVAPEAATPAKCGAKLKKAEVLVLDLESFGDDGQAAQAFVAQHVTGLELAGESPEEVRTRKRTTRMSREKALENAQAEGAKRGCDVVLVLAAWTAEDGAVAVQTGPQLSVGVALRYGYATVLFGTGDH